MELQLGKVEGKPFRAALDVLRRTHLLITGVSGSGKSYRLRVLAESLAPIIPVIIVDLEGEYFTLREQFPFVLFGEDGDAPLSVATAEVTARKVLEWGCSAIFDLSSLDVENQHEWAARCFHALLAAPRELWAPRAVLIDEAHTLMPEKGEAHSPALAAGKNLCARGRKRGYFITLATQRLSKLSNSCASEMQNYLVGRTTLASDRERAAKMLGIVQRADRAAFDKSVKVLEDHYFWGQGIAVAPERVLLAPLTAKTTHVRPGEIKQQLPVTPEEVRRFLPQLSQLAEEAQAGAPAPSAETTTNGKRAGGEDAARLARQLAEAREEIAGLRSRLGSVRAAWREAMDRRAGALDFALNDLEIVRAGYRDFFGEPAPPPAGAAAATAPAAALEDAPRAKDDLSENSRQILEGLRRAELVGQRLVTRSWLAAIVGASPTSSTYRMNLAALERRGYLRFPRPNHVCLSDKGRGEAGEVAPLTTTDLLDGLRGILEPARYAVMRYLVEAEGECTREELAEAAKLSCDSHTFRAHLKALKSLGFVEIRAGQARVHDFVYLRGQA